MSQSQAKSQSRIEAMTCAEGAPHAEEKTAALTCLKSWLNLSASEAADLLILPGSLQSTQVHKLPCTLICDGCIVNTENNCPHRHWGGYNNHPCAFVQEELFALVLKELASPDEETADLATEIILFLMGEDAPHL